MKPMISMAATAGLLEAIEAAGTRVDDLLRAVGLHRSLLTNRDGFIPCAVFAWLLEEAARVTGDDCFGLHFGERFDPRNIGPLAYVVLNAATVALADQQVARYLKLYNQAARVSTMVDGQRASMSYVLADLGVPLRQQNEYGMVIRLNTIRMMVGSRWSPLEVQFAHEMPENISEHERIFCAPVLFCYPTNNLLVDAEFLNCRVPGADPELYRIVQRMFGGNSNWRGPIWMPVNGLILRALLNFYLYYGDEFKIECPDRLRPVDEPVRSGAGNSQPLTRIFLRECSTSSGQIGRRPVYGGTEKFQTDRHWGDYVSFFEYFHGDNGAGLGASHQTGWTGLAAMMIELFGSIDGARFLEVGRAAAFARRKSTSH